MPPTSPTRAAPRAAERIVIEPTIVCSSTTPVSDRGGSFAELGLDGELRQIDVIIGALVRLTHAAIGPMTYRGAGTVINVSSMSGLQPVPLMATHGATDSFVNSFTDALHEATRGPGVNVMSDQALTPPRDLVECPSRDKQGACFARASAGQRHG